MYVESDRPEGAVNRRHLKVGHRSHNPGSRNVWRGKKLLARKQTRESGGNI
jgi:hypothetical protein